MHKSYIYRKTIPLFYSRHPFTNGEEKGDLVTLKEAITLKPNKNSDHTSEPVSVNQILATKKIALRRRVWFRALNRVERGILDLTTKYVVRIKSPKLAKVVTAILSKLEAAVESIVDRLVRTVGFSLAQKISDFAKRFGNRNAQGWAVDAAFARFLAVMHFNAGRSSNP